MATLPTNIPKSKISITAETPTMSTSSQQSPTTRLFNKYYRIRIDERASNCVVVRVNGVIDQYPFIQVEGKTGADFAVVL